MRALAPLAGRHAAIAQAQRHIVGDTRPGQQRILLEDDAAIAARAVDFLSIEQDFAVCQRQEAGDGVQQRRFSATGRAKRHDDRPGGNGKGHPVEGVDLLPIGGGITDSRVSDIEHGVFLCAGGDEPCLCILRGLMRYSLWMMPLPHFLLPRGEKDWARAKPYSEASTAAAYCGSTNPA